MIPTRLASLQQKLLDKPNKRDGFFSLVVNESNTLPSNGPPIVVLAKGLLHVLKLYLVFPESGSGDPGSRGRVGH